jgi:hypothetical protein
MAMRTFCTNRLQARRARSDAPYHNGFMADILNTTFHFGMRGKINLHHSN